MRNLDAPEQAVAQSPTVGGVLPIVCVIHGIVVLLIAALFPGPNETPYFLGVAIGIVFSQASISAGWFSLGWPGRKLGVPACIFFPSLGFLFYAERTGAPPEICLLVALAASFQFAIMLVPMWLTQRFGWGLEKSEQQFPEGKFNFEIRHIMIWTGCIAVLLAIARTAIPKVMETVGDTGEILLLFLIFSTGNIVLAGPLVWTIFSSSRRVIWLVVFLFALGSVTYAEQFLLGKLKDLGTINWGVSISTVGAYTATLLTVLVPLRLQGWVLRRHCVN